MTELQSGEQNKEVKTQDLPKEIVPDREFLLLEYESLRQEQIMKIKETSSLSQFALVTHGAIWAWLATHQNTLPSKDIVIWFPVVLALLFIGLYWSRRRDIRVIGEKIERLESHFSIPVYLAWESDITETYSRTRVILWSLWVLLFFTNVAIIFIILN